ncbi:16S rRNA (cytosine(1402)-N(4))-methyltransferase RsmH [Blastopirellula sp. JC732]|uniref:Ribosomal RNA small subunit methyltransferase H n=1 Tax=Blastopirellula sediminis TaxID=2894196 RepID=A0A9X1MMH6_9BACT|nr:16S rRNA (cytosine(1402)-N(4))-methyltransferase RsmH [Blastopirellula sediminis]MCC9609019.1 16S rRNA (cytosine(1402)-N(4))-methyltransferase RsmH [Blastopirellula sediminis]MCC9628204.1 16S rRNA (cytosine(1402)-N(4))-methyltransferase RsmH [Blastopirellula sediminis]
MTSTVHVSVLPQEVIEYLDPQPGQIFADGTLGGGGHTRQLAERVGDTGLVIACDRDLAAIERAEQSLRGLPIKVTQRNFSELPSVLKELEIDQIDGLLLDLGLSSDQLADRNRGFSFDSDGPLDLRFDDTEGDTAADLVNLLSEKDLADVIYQNGEERLSRRIAKKICLRRKEKPFLLANDLAELCASCYPARGAKERIHPATRTFQALRIAVNRELSSLESILKTAPDFVRVGGKIAIISFHSLEDRRVKEAFREDPRLEPVTKKPIIPSEEEILRNPRSRSAKLRVARRT